MFERLTIRERIVGAAAILGLLATYMTWTSFDTGLTRTSLNGFRASVVGDIYAIALGVVLFALALHLRLLRLPRVLDHEPIIRIASRVALGAVVLQLLLFLDAGQHMHLASGIALVAAAAMVLASRRQDQRTAGDF